MNKTTPLTLPTLAAFKEMSFKNKGKVFLKWVKTQKGTYKFSDVRSCALYQFGKAITNDCISAAVFHFSTLGTTYEGGETRVLSFGLGNSLVRGNNRNDIQSFRNLARRLETYIKKL